MVAMRSVIRMVVVSAALTAIGSTRAEANGIDYKLRQLDDANLIDLLDADLDESFLIEHHRALQEDTPAPSPASVRGTLAPTSTVTMTPAPTPGDRNVDVTMTPTAAPSGGERGGTFTDSPTPGPTTSGVWRPVPSAAMALGAVVLAAMSGAAVFA